MLKKAHLRNYLEKAQNLVTSLFSMLFILLRGLWFIKQVLPEERRKSHTQTSLSKQLADYRRQALEGGEEKEYQVYERIVKKVGDQFGRKEKKGVSRGALRRRKQKRHAKRV